MRNKGIKIKFFFKELHTHAHSQQQAALQKLKNCIDFKG